MFSSLFRNEVSDLAPYIRRLCNVTTPNKLVPYDQRTEDRFNRALPVIVCPWIDREPVMEQITVAITKDISDRGIGLIRTSPLNVEEVVIGFWLDEMSEPWYFRAQVRSSDHIGGGYWLVGVSLEEFMNQNHRRMVEPLDVSADFLRPSYQEPVNAPVARPAIG